jgi:hypothetical protein
MKYSSITSNTQEVLLTTIHNQNSVVEVYLNDKSKIISELIHLSGHKIRLYQYALEEYKALPGANMIIA